MRHCRILILENEPKSPHRNIGEYEVDFMKLYDDQISPCFAKVIRHLPFISESFLYQKRWKKDLNVYDWIITFDASVNKKALCYIDKRKCSEKMILVFDNRIGKRESELHRYAERLGIRQVTYSDLDAQKYNIRFVPQFWDYERYQKVVLLPEQPQEDKWDLIFIGRAKKRLEKIKEIEKNVQQEGLKTNFWIVSDKAEEGTHSQARSYESYLQDVIRSNTILDVVGENNWGLTWRPMEALFLKKKLITNYSDIKKSDFYEAYHENIMILKNGNENQIGDFLKKPYESCAMELKKYTYEGWLDQLCKLN